MKGRKAPHQRFATTRSSVPGGRGHSDLKTLKHRTRDGYKYIAVLVDDCTRKRWVAFLKKKTDFLAEMKKWILTLQSEGVSLRVLRSDNGSEYIDANCVAYLNSVGCAQELSPPHCQSANGVAEKSWSDLLAMARCILNDQKKGREWWGVAVQFATYITNHLRTEAVDDVPPEAAWKDMPIDVSHFRVPLCICWYYVEIENRDDKSLSPVRRKATFVGYAHDSPSYLVRDEITHRVYRRRYADVLFDERSINPHDASNPVPTQAQVEATSDDYVELQPSTPTQLDSPPTSSTTSDATVGPNLDSNSNVSLDGQLDGKEFMRISTDLRVTEVARIFDCSPSNYLKFVKAKYDGDWITKLNS